MEANKMSVNVTMQALELTSGDRLPAVGSGFWKVEKNAVSSLLAEAIECGYRHLDCACDYGNEDAIGEALHSVFKAGKVSRESLWVTSKLWNTYHAARDVRPALERTLRDLKLDYLDLYLIHFPIALKYVPFEKRYPPGWFHDPDTAMPKMEPAQVPIIETWRAMEELVRAGLVRNIGVSNFNASLLRDLIASAEIAPSVLQVETHPLLTQEKLLRFCQEQNVVVTAFSPLGAPSYLPLGMAHDNESILNLPLILDIATRHGKSAAQIVLRWGVQRGTSVIPKTIRVERLKENIGIFDFELSSDEMSSIGSLNCNRRFNDPGVFCELAFNTFFPIYE